MRLRRRILGWIRSLIFGTILIVGGGGLILIGAYFPDILSGFGINELYLRIIGFVIMIVVVVVIIAVFETLEHL